ncbi:hypothetical protein WA158_000318 [Blastocystis sp. Blastoise]
MESINQETKTFITESSFVLENGIEKPLSEKRSFDVITLKNGLKALLISDPLSDNSLASMCVNVGSFRDPKETLGLAHFVEHLLFMGTEDYPDENEYTKFIEGHNGFTNAYTDVECTNFYFEVSNDYYDHSLELFSGFFICPLFKTDCVVRERQAVNNEYSSNIQNNDWRESRMNDLAFKPDHPASYFNVGTEVTLGAPDIRDQAFEFYSKYYSSDHMTVVLLSNCELDQLRFLATKYFSEIPKRNNSISPISSDLLSPAATRCIWTILPVGDKKKLNLTWVLPSVYGHYPRGSIDYLSHIMGYEGKGSLAAYLKDNHYITDLVAGCEDELSCTSLFSVNLTLTEKGLEAYMDVINYVYQYINLMKTQGPSETLYRQFHDISAVSFAYAEKSNDTEVIACLAQDLHLKPARYILHADHPYREYNPMDIIDLLNCFTIENSFIQLYDPRCEAKCTETEEYYQIKYYKQTISDAILSSWEHAVPLSSFHYPLQNPFIPRNLNVFKQNIDGDDTLPPQLVEDASDIQLYIKSETPFNVPKLSLSILLNSLYVSSTPTERVLSSLLHKCVSHQVNEFLYDATITGVEYKLTLNNGHGICINIEGFDEHIPVILRTILSAFASLSISEQEFNDIKTEKHTALDNYLLGPLYQQTTDILSSLAFTRYNHIDQLENIECVTLQQVKNHATHIIQNCRIDGIITGNITKEKANEYVSLIREVLKPSGIQRDIHGNIKYGLEVYSTSLEKGRKYIYPLICKNEQELCSSVAVLIPVTNCNEVLEDVRTSLFVEMVSNECFDVLRTKQQLGYIVWLTKINTDGYRGVECVVQSDSYDALHVYTCIMDFFQYLQEYLLDMSEDEFEEYKESVYDGLTQNIDNIHDLHQKYGKEVLFNQYQFNRNIRDAEIVLKITKSEMITYYNTYINPQNTGCSYLTVLMGNKQKPVNNLPKDSNTIVIEDIQSFRNTRTSNPLYYSLPHK